MAQLALMNMVNILVYDVGSTYTKVTGFRLEKQAQGPVLSFSGRAQAPTTVVDITVGLQAAREAMTQGGVCIAGDATVFSSCSAAGGLRMVAMGYMPRVTVKASKEVAMNSGARVLEVLSSTEAPEFREEVLQEIRPDIILLTGGTDGGNTEAIAEHAESICNAVKSLGMVSKAGNWKPVVIVAGNQESQGLVAAMFRTAGVQCVRVPNVLPTIHDLRVKPAREAIHEQFIRQITRAPGLSSLVSMTADNKVVPTPGAVLLGAELLACGTYAAKGAGSLMVVDIGGATTDVHSVMPELEELALEERGLIVSNEKQMVYRTVEGNLGMRISACGIVESLGAQQVLACADPVELAACTGVSPEQKMPQDMLDDLAAQLQNYTEKLEAQPQSIVPEGSGLEAAFDTALATAALAVAIRRHAGKIAEKNIEMGIGAGVPVGRDLRKITKVLAVGGIFAHSSPQRSLGILQRAFARPGYSLLPAQCDFVVDRNYLLYSLGVLAQQYPDAALDFGLQAFALEREG